MDGNDETFLDLVTSNVRKEGIKLTPTELLRLTDESKIYDNIEALIELHGYTIDDMDNIALAIVQFIRDGLPLKEKDEDCCQFLKEHRSIIDLTRPYESMLYLAMINFFAEQMRLSDVGDVLRQVSINLRLDNIASQRRFLVYTIIPLYNKYIYGIKPTLAALELTAALGDPTNPKYDSNISRYLKDRYGNKYYMEWDGMIQRYITDVDTALHALRNIIANEEAIKYTPGTQAYRETIDNAADRAGQLSAACKKLSYDELEIIVGNALSSASLTQICTIVTQYSSRLDLTEPCTSYNVEDLLDVLLQLIKQLPKVELCRIMSILGKSLVVASVSSDS